MKRNSLVIAWLALLIFPFFGTAQVVDDAVEEIADYHFNSDSKPCISKAEYAILEKQCAESVRKFGLESKLNRNVLTTSLAWPIKAASNLADCGYHFIGAYVDQNTAVGTFSDFNCEANTYDAHQGTDIAIWPYGFYKMDNSQVEVIAAAAGTIVQKADGNFDRNCSANTLTANSIIIQHADGSYALYWHMKKNSVTSKTVGQTVALGEYLGVVGSSGSASGPHLHFEIWSGATSSTYKDPFSGPCNTLNANSWWAVQKPHTDSKVIKVSVNTTDIVLPGCPNTETPNESDSFTIPFQGAGLAPGYAKFYVFSRDENTGLTSDCKILNPNGSTFNSWTYTSTTYNKIYIRGYSKLLPTIPGLYMFQVAYNGVTCAKTFTIVNPLGLPDLTNLSGLRVYPNPATDSFSVLGSGIENGNYRLTLRTVSGQIIIEEQITVSANEVDKSFSIAKLAHGIYFLTADNGKSQIVRKIVKQ